MNDRTPVSGAGPAPAAPPGTPVCDGGRRALDVDAACSLLRNAERRRVLRLLLDADGTLRVTELAGEIRATAADEGRARDVAAELGPRRSASGERVATSLREVHLPRLAAYGLVEFDRERGRVTPLAPIDVFEEPLALSENRSFWRLERG